MHAIFPEIGLRDLETFQTAEVTSMLIKVTDIQDIGAIQLAIYDSLTL